jgi:hypothetical protein
VIALGATGVSVSFGVIRALVPVLLLGLVLLGVSIFLALRFWERRSVAMNVHRINEARERDRTVRRQGRVGTEEGLRVAQSGVQNILRELGVHDIASAEKLLTAEQGRRQEIATLQVQVSALLGGQTGSVTELRDRAALEMEQKTAAVAALGPIANDARARERLEAEVRDRHAALERARDAEAAAIARVDANPVDSEQVAGEAERVVTWQGQLGALKRRVRIYEMTLAAIAASESGTMRKATRFLEQQVGRDIARLTGGRYGRVGIDDQTLDIQIWAPERGDWVAANQLSKGTVDQVFLAARIGLVRLVTQGRHPPLVLDDPFVTFDDTRAARAALLLRELSADFQVIYLACSNRYDGLADAVVELPGPTEAEQAAAESAPLAEAQPNVSAEGDASAGLIETGSADATASPAAPAPPAAGAAPEATASAAAPGVEVAEVAAADPAASTADPAASTADPAAPAAPDADASNGEAGTAGDAGAAGDELAASGAANGIIVADLDEVIAFGPSDGDLPNSAAGPAAAPDEQGEVRPS